MRDILKYEDDYKNINGFEKYQVKYRRYRVLESLNKLDKAGSILEIGCGLEPLFLYYNNFKKYICIEPSNVFYESAIVNSKNDKRIVVYNNYFENIIKEIDIPIDFIVCGGLLHEVEKPLKILEGIKLISNKDTIIHINVPNAFSFHRILAEKSGLIKNVHEKSQNNMLLQQNTVFDMDSIINLIKSVGDIEILEKGTYFIKPFSHAQMEECLKHNIINEDILNGLYRMTEYSPDFGSELYTDFKWL